MSSKPGVTVTVVEQRGEKPCHRGHVPGQTFDFDTQRGELCPMAMHCAFPYIDILRYGGSIPGQPEGTATFCCSDPDTVMVFRAETADEQSGKMPDETAPGTDHTASPVRYEITEECIGCGLCLSICPGISIDGTFVPFVIDQEKCQHCGACMDTCPANAIITV